MNTTKRTKVLLALLPVLALLVAVPLFADSHEKDKEAQRPQCSASQANVCPATQAASCPMAAKCQTCPLAQQQLQDLKQLRDRLLLAKQAADDANAEQAVRQIDIALQLLDKQHSQSHLHLAAHAQKAHAAAPPGQAASSPCPLCPLKKEANPTQAAVNTRCPIMGSKVNPQTQLTRSLDGQTVGFCCPGCLKKWDQMTQQQQKQKLHQAIQKEQSSS